jgi:hypothetical protein
MSLGTAIYEPTLGYNSGYDAQLVSTITKLRYVRHVHSFAALNAYRLKSNGAPDTSQNANIVGSIDGQYFSQDRLTVIRGRMADPHRSDEMVMSAVAAHAFGLRVGDVSPWAVYPSSINAPTVPAVHLMLRLVGIVVFSDNVVQDQIDAESTQQSVVFTPALTDRLVACCSNYSFSYLQLTNGSRSVAKVETEIEHVFPTNLPFDPHTTSVVLTKAQRAIKPEVVALGAFGAIAALAILVIASQVLVRQLRLAATEVDILRALGADPSMTTSDGLIGAFASIAFGAILAAAVAVVLSPLAPLGSARAVDPTLGIAFDWPVLGLGILVFLTVLATITVVTAHRWAPHRVTNRDRSARIRGSSVADALAAAGAPAPAVTGVRFALQPGASSDPVPVRSAILGAVLAMTVVVATVVFGASLSSLVSHPPLYGWNWSVALSGGGGVGDIPQHQSATLLNHDPNVARWSGYSFGTLQIDNLSVPVLGGTPNAPVGPPLLTGHGMRAPDQIVLGSSTLAQLHDHIGDTVKVSFGSGPETRLRIVGTATMPTVGITGIDTTHLSMGTGALLSYKLIPESVRNSFGNTPAGPNTIFVRFRHGTDPTASLRSLNRMAATLTLPTNYGVSVQSVQLPAEIINYRSIGEAPAILSGALALGAVVALGLTLTASVRRRRRDLALLKTLGFTRWQLAASVGWQASVGLAIGALVGTPVGIVIGRFLWDLFAHQINAVPEPTVPTLLIVVIVASALVIANLVAAIPARVAADTSTAPLLRAE